MDTSILSRNLAKALQRPPVFGDVEQIKALHLLRAQEEIEEEERQTAEREGLSQFKVTVEWSGEETVTVWAKNESEAKTKARDEIDIDDFDISYSVRKVSE